MGARGLSLLATLVLVVAIVALLFRHALFADRTGWVIAQLGAGLLMVWARMTLGLRSFHASANPTEGELITHGPYRWIRNPIYAAILLFTWAGVACHLARVNAALALVASLGLGVRIATEEHQLREHYAGYADYAARTRRIIPFLF